MYFFYVPCSFGIWNILRSMNPQNFELFKTTTFMKQTPLTYVQHCFSSATPSAIMMTARMNMISPAGQKQESASPIPNAMQNCTQEPLQPFRYP